MQLSKSGFANENGSRNASAADLYKQLLDVSSQLEKFIQSNNITVNCGGTFDQSKFMSLSREEQVQLIERLQFFWQVCGDTTNENTKFDDKRLVWSAISKLKVRPPSDLFSLILPDDYIEIYDINGIQVFRNFEFCKLVTYTLHEILIYSWAELYYRDNQYTQQIFNSFFRVFKEGQVLSGPSLSIDTHDSYENKSKSGRTFKVEMKYFAPLFGENDKVVYMFAGSKITRLT